MADMTTPPEYDPVDATEINRRQTTESSVSRVAWNLGDDPR